MLSCILSARSLYRASKAGALAQRDLVAVWHCDQLLLFIDQVEAEWLLDLVACEVAEA